MLQPGSKKWIEKYFDLCGKGKIDLSNFPIDSENSSFLHARLFQTGLAFGYPSKFIYLKDPVKFDNWTINERLVVLLFESLLHVYKIEHKKLDEVAFKQSLMQFYKDYQEHYSINVFSFFSKESESEKLERILAQRVHVKRTWTNLIWVNYLNNSLIFLDVLAYRQFLISGNTLNATYDHYADAVLKTIILASYADGTIEPQEKTLYDVFISSANLSPDLKKVISKASKEGTIRISDINLPDVTDELLAYYLIDIAVLTIFSDLEAMDDEVMFLYELCNYLGIDTDYLHQTMALVEIFVIENNHKISFLQENSSYERLYRSFSKRWIKVLGRNKDQLVEELKQNKELVTLFNKSIVKELSPAEKEKMKSQFKDLIKSMPSLAIFMLPGGALLLPIILRIIPDLLPSSFRHNQLKDKEDEKED